MKKIVTYYLKPYYGAMAFGFSIKFMGTIMDLCLPWILAYMIDTVIARNNRMQIYLWGGVMILCSLLAVSFNVIANRLASKVSRDATRAIRHDLFKKTAYLSSAQTDAFTKPSLISRLTSDTYYIHQVIGHMQRLGVRAPILAIGGILVTLTLDPVLTLVLLSVMPFIVWTTISVSKKSIPMYTSLQESVDQFVRLIREDIAGIRVIKALSKTDSERRKYESINNEVVQKEKKAGMLMAVLNPMMNLFFNIGLVLVILAGAYRVNSGKSEVGKILAFMTYFTIILISMMIISNMFNIISKAMVSANRIMAVLDTPEDMLPSLLEGKKSDAFIEFEDVSFSYDKAEPNLEHISFCLKKGETLGIIGATGAGKTTLIHLLLRLYDADEGNIYIDGTHIKSMDAGQLRKRFGVVFQNDALFEDSISENIRLGRELSDEQIQEAVLYAKAKEFVEDESRGYYDKLEIKGANLSGGQKQRILIARALAAHPEILLLDDSSSALDYKTDAALRRELKEHFQDTTTIIVAQRISSLMYADHIMVLEEGSMTGYGSHEELMKSCEIYREISESQMGSVLCEDGSGI